MNILLENIRAAAVSAIKELRPLLDKPLTQAQEMAIQAVTPKTISLIENLSPETSIDLLVCTGHVNEIIGNISCTLVNAAQEALDKPRT